MKLIRFGNVGEELPGILDDENNRRDLSTVFQDFDKEFFNGEGLEKLRKIKDFSIFPIINREERWGSCIARPGKVICIGLNYRDHAKESGMVIPKEPIIFQKAANTVVGPYDTILIPRMGLKTDWEVEIGIVIGNNASYLDSEDVAKDYIAGYCISHDVSERSFQLERGGQWTKGKSCDNFNPTGPFLATADEIKDIHNIGLRLSVNGREMQNGNSGKMIFNMHYLVYYLSQFMTLEAGDLISTGTPKGVGLGMNPQVFLKEYDMVELWVEGLGYQKQICKQA